MKRTIWLQRREDKEVHWQGNRPLDSCSSPPLSSHPLLSLLLFPLLQWSNKWKEQFDYKGEKTKKSTGREIDHLTLAVHLPSLHTHCYLCCYFLFCSEATNVKNIDYKREKTKKSSNRVIGQLTPTVQPCSILIHCYISLHSCFHICREATTRNNIDWRGKVYQLENHPLVALQTDILELHLIQN